MTAQFDTYKDKYTHVRLERDEAGVLTMTLHADGSGLKWSWAVGRDLAGALADVAADPGNELVIITGAGDTFVDGIDYRPLEMPDRTLDPRTMAAHAGPSTMDYLLSITCPVIAAVNGPARVHAEIAVMADIVIASENALFQDAAHYPAGIVPGDGVHVVWPMLLGPNRGRYFLLTGEEIHARDALQLGIVSEVVAQDELMPRARELAALLLKAPRLVRRHTRTLLSRALRRAMLDELELGHALEGHAWTAFGPYGDFAP